VKTSFQINTCAGYLKPISFKKFLELVPIKEATKSTYWFNQKVDSIYDLAQPDDSLVVQDHNYIRCVVHLSENFDSLKKDLFTHTTILRVFKYPIFEMAENGAVESLIRSGNPEYLVRVSPRAWLIANPNDFALVKHGDATALACYFKNRSLLYVVERTTEE
jgi:hypothetical protein